MIPLKPLRLANIALAAFLVYLTYSTLESHWQPGTMRKGRVKKEEEESAQAEKPKITYSRYRVIEQANIFKNRDIVRRSPTPSPVPPTPRPLPDLKLELKGTTTSRRDGHVKAIIFNKKTRKTELYKENDVLPDTDGARIISITRERIIMDRGGQEKTLQLYPEDLKMTRPGDQKDTKVETKRPRPVSPEESWSATATRRLYR